MKINTNLWKISLRFGLRRISSGPISNANQGISVRARQLQRRWYFVKNHRVFYEIAYFCYYMDCIRAWDFYNITDWMKNWLHEKNRNFFIWLLGFITVCELDRVYTSKLYSKWYEYDRYRVIYFVVSKVNIVKTHKIFFLDIYTYILLILNVDVMCETLHHLNDLHTKCCKHWFFWSNFQPFFDANWAESQPSHLWIKDLIKQLLILDVMASFRLLEDSQNPKYDNFVY